MTYITNRDFFYDVNHGSYAGMEAGWKYGRNSDIDTGVEQDLWETGGLISWQTAAEKVNITGGANDVLTTGSGGWKVYLSGLDATYTEINEVVNLNGAADVESSNTYLRLQRMYITECGSGGVNAGTITATGVDSSDIHITISPLAGQSEHMAITVPALKHFQILDWVATAIDTAASPTERSSEVYFYTRLYNESSTDNYDAWRRQDTKFLQQSGASRDHQDYSVFSILPSKTDIRVAAITSKDSTHIHSRMEYICEENH